MKNISLLPSQYKKNQIYLRKRSNMMLAAGIIAVILFILYNAMNVYLIIPSSQLKSLQAENDKILMQTKEVSGFESKYNEILYLDEEIKKAYGTTPEWQKIILSIGESLPSDMWVTDISASYIKKDDESVNNSDQKKTSKGMNDKSGSDQILGEATVKGWSMSNSDVAQWVEILKNNSLISEVRCQNILQGEYNGYTAVQFEIYFKILPGNALRVFKEGASKNAE